MEPLLKRQREAIAQMFGAIALRYDLLNRLLSGWQDVRWRQFAVKWLPRTARWIVDIGTGTGDFAFAALRRCPEALVIGIDISPRMLSLARWKAKKNGLEKRCWWVLADGLKVPFPDGKADAVLSAFVIRNFEDLLHGLREMARLLRPGGVALILEFCQPPDGWWQTPIGLFVRYGVPLLGRLWGNPLAYAYLTASIRTFLPAEEIAKMLRCVGFRQAVWMPLTFGVATLFRAVK
ncbi:MAG: hypothetical protein IMHGJWDQ_000438 [Candidatus Fervidibacter sp.]